MTDLQIIASKLRNHNADIQVLYAFNSVGKTRLSLEFQNLTKDNDGNHSGICYNAYSEDIFVWENDISGTKSNNKLTVIPSDLSALHDYLTEGKIHAKLKPYKVSFDFFIQMHSNVEDGIKFISFFPMGETYKADESMKISRGEERIFIWCFFLAMMEVEGWADIQSEYIFIDDPVSSLDDHNIFVTATTLLKLIETHFEKRKMIIATHHAGLFSILLHWLKSGEKGDMFKVKGSKDDYRYQFFILSRKRSQISLESYKRDVFLYHLRLIQILNEVWTNRSVNEYHFAMLRQVLEMISSFLGSPRFSYTLQCIGYTNADEISRIVNSLTHKNVFYYDSVLPVPDHQELFYEIMRKLIAHFKFISHPPRHD